jgi:hypothetical protein
MNELKDKICAHFDELSLLDFLDISMEQLVDYLEDAIEESRERLERELR